jgi:septum site-determining protein MinD
MGKAYVITSGKGGTGKTTTAAALSGCLALMGYKTLCLDADMGLKNLDLCLGLSDMAIMDFCDVLDGRAALSEAVVAHPLVSNLFFLTAPVSVAPESVDPDAMRCLTDQIKREYDFLIIDSPAGIGSGFKLSRLRSRQSAACCHYRTVQATGTRPPRALCLSLSLWGKHGYT